MLEKTLLTKEQAEKCALALGCVHISIQVSKTPIDMGMPPEPFYTNKVWLFPDQTYEDTLSLDPDFWEPLLWLELRGMCKDLVSQSYWPKGLYEHDTGPRTEIQYAELNILVDDVHACIAIAKAIEILNAKNT